MESKGTTVVASCIHQALTDSHRYTTLTDATFREFKNRELGTPESQKILEGVSLMTPESIHVNAFMYEPIIDMSDTALRKLYRQAKKLESQPSGDENSLGNLFTF